MNWKQLFLFDLRRILPGYRLPAETGNEPRELWFVALWHVLTGTQRIRPRWRKPVPLEDAKYKPGRYYQTRGRRWPGPFYVSAPRWRQELMYTVGQLTAIARTNASLTRGLEAVAREERRLNTQATAKHLFVMLQAAAVMAAILGAGLAVGANNFRDMDSPIFLLYFVGIAVSAIIPALFILNRSGRLEAVFLTLRDRLAAGEPLSDAMQALPRFFPRLYADMVRAGEDSGRLAECLDQLGDDTLRAVTVAQALRLNFAYLGFIFVVQGLLMSFIALKILPIFRDIFREFGGELPAPTKAVMRIGLWLSNNNPESPITRGGCGDLVSKSVAPGPWLTPFTVLGPILLVGLFFFIVLRLRRRHGVGTHPLAALFLLIPGLRGLMIRQNLSHIALILEKLLGAGVPLDRALESAANADLNPLYAESVRRLRKRILQGETLADACDAEAHLPPIPKSFRGIVAIGEHSGMLPQALARIAEFYQGQVDKRTRIIVDTLLPFGVIVLGYVTLMVELAIYLSVAGIGDTIIGTM